MTESMLLVEPPRSADPADPPRPVATRRVLLACVACGAAIDLVLHARGIGIGAAVLPIAIAGLLLATGAIPNRRARLLLAPITLLAPWVAIRANPTLHALDLLASFGLLILAVAAGSGRAAPDAATDGGRSAGAHLAAGLRNTPRFVAGGVSAGVAAPDPRTITAIGRGLIVAVPVTVVVGILLASADENFASLFGLADPPTIVTHVLLSVSGAIGTAALFRTALTARRAPTPRTLTISPTEASVVLATLVGIYTLFVVARVVHVATDAPVEQLADEARAGFFQLVAVVVITVAVLCGARALVSVRSRPFILLASSLAVLTLAIVWVALVRLDRYRDEFGLTQLRLATTWFSVWLAVVVIVVACSFIVRHLRWLHFVAAAALVWLAAWNVHNPDHHIAATNLDRAVTGARFDADFVAGLSEDAIPAIVTRIDDLPPAQRDALYDAVCAKPTPHVDSTLAWNRARARGRQALMTLCAR